MAEKKYALTWREDMEAVVTGGPSGWDVRCGMSGDGSQIVLVVEAYFQERKFGAYNINTGRRAFENREEIEAILNAHPQAVEAAIDNAQPKLQKFLNAAKQILGMTAR